MMLPAQATIWSGFSDEIGISAPKGRGLCSVGHAMGAAWTAVDEEAGGTVAELITKAGFDPVKAGGLAATGRLEVFGDLHAFGGLNGRLVGRAEALELVHG